MAMTLAVATLLGFLTGLGVGGGSLLILWLTLGLGMEQALARGINLLFFLPSAMIACCFRWRQGTLPLKKIGPALLSGCISAAVFTWVGLQLDTLWMKKLFGGLLLVTGMREIMWRPK